MAELKGRKRACIEHMLKGETPGEIAVGLGIDEQTIERWKADDAFAHAFDEGIKRSINYAAALALKTETELMAKGGNTALSAAKDILDRGGFKKGASFAGGFKAMYVDDIAEDIL